MLCCANCFGDRALARIIAADAACVGTCSYCGSADVALLPPKALETKFATLISIYEPDATGAGEALAETLMRDWGLFSHPRMDALRGRGLLTDILDDGELVRQRFNRSPRYAGEGLHLRWDKLRDELRFQNRYFPQEAIDENRLESLLTWLVADAASPLPAVWFRARLAQGDSAFAAKDMGAPPASVSSHGRANPAGIPYLYLGSTETTAVAEIRPHTGERVCVAEFRLNQPVQLVDLRNPRKLLSPFFFDDEASIATLLADLPFVERLGLELTRPVVPQRAAVEYVPSQYLCEFIKKVGHDGVLYRSSVSEGMNLALFNPALATAGTVVERRVAEVSVKIE